MTTTATQTREEKAASIEQDLAQFTGADERYMTRLIDGRNQPNREPAMDIYDTTECATNEIVTIESSVGGSIWLACGGLRYMIDGGDGVCGIEITTVDPDICESAGVELSDVRKRTSTATWKYLGSAIAGKTLAEAVEWLDENTTHDSTDWYRQEN